jgi:hypothetical protein
MSTPPEAWKQRELLFSRDPPGQAERALELLKGLDNLRAEPGEEPESLKIGYSLAHYSLEGLEQALIKEGFAFDENPLHQIGRKLIHYCEEVEYHNLKTPEWPHRTREHEIFVKVYDRHLHGDHDDTPPELRDYR